ncbi:MAG: ATP-binding protein [Planctomycetaceae bacterium]|jgi:predicted protein tyrosine phosphatase|nr:ATP-binding protein [Planctomycetaceae bacterium]
MKIDIEGRLAKFPLSTEKSLMPLFEAISNSIHAIAEAKNNGGKITIKIKRDTESKLLNEKNLYPIAGFTVEDDGIGFNDANYDSFATADSTKKINIGGKGVGRFTWLKVFNKVEIDSVFEDKSQLKRRKFSFSVNDIQDEQTEIVKTTEQRKTKITFLQMSPEYQKHCPKNIDTIIRKIVEHFLFHFSTSRTPLVMVIDDEDNNKTYNLNKEFEKKIKLNVSEETISIGTYKFKLKHFRLRSETNESQHNIHFCAYNRSVEMYYLKNKNSLFQKIFYDSNNNPFVYSCCVSSKFFDEQTDQTRTKLDIIDESNNTLLPSVLSREKILNKINECSEKHLDDVLKPVKEQNKKRVIEFIHKHPRYRPLIGLRPQWLEKLNRDYTEEELNLELFKLFQKFESEVIQEGERIQKSKIEQQTSKSYKEEKRKFKKYIEATNDIGMSKLADYVIHRRAITNIISNSLKASDEGAYEYEEVIHNIIFPMGKTSDTILNENQSNLWMIDDRLSYHRHLASDKPLTKSNSKKSPDLLVYQSFDRPHAFSDSTTQPFSSITIVEFKRPMRNDYVSHDPQKDPVLQVLNYVDLIRKGKIKNNDGRSVHVDSGAQFYAYVICDITDRFVNIAANHDLLEMPDGLGYYKWHATYKVYLEVISYQKLIQDAEKRNQIFFEKLGIPLQ